MDYKKTNAPTNTQTQDIKKLEEGVENVYEAAVIISKRANQISKDLKEELNQKLEEFASYTDNLEEVFENKEQIEISKFYERLPKPTLLALQEYLDGQIYYRSPETGNENTPDSNDQ